MTRSHVLVLVAMALLAAPRGSAANVVVVPDDYPTISQALAAIVAWDTVLVRSGVYREDIPGAYPFFYRLFAQDGPESTTVIGSLSTGWIDFGNIDIDVRGFTFREGSGMSFYTAGGSATIKIRDCVIEHNDGGAQGGAIDFTATAGSADIESCTIRYNGADRGGGVYAVVPFGQIVIARTTIVDNAAPDGGGGIYAQAHLIQLEHSTLARNRGGGLERHGSGTSPRLTMSQTIVASNSGGFGIWCEYPPAVTAILCSDVWGNEAGEYGGACPDPTGTHGNISLDPLFCDPERGDYYIGTQSPCAPEASPPGCGLIGALPVGCAPSSITMGAPNVAPLTLSVAPTPFATVAQVTLAASQGPLLLGVYDAHGRLLQCLPGRSDNGCILWLWGGTLSSGDLAPNGLYLLRAVSAGTTVGTGKALLLR